MRIVRHSPTELVAEESTLWIAALLIVAAFPLVYAGFLGIRGGFVVAGFLFLCALVWLRRTTFQFDAVRRMAQWKSLRGMTVQEGSVPFGEIAGIGLETSSGRRGNAKAWRLTLLTAGKPIPLSGSYGTGEKRYRAMRDEIERFVLPKSLPPR